MIHCFKCGTDLPDNMIYCLHCGSRLSDEAETVVKERIEPPTVITPKPTPPKKTASAGWTIFFLVVGGGILAVFAIANLNRQSPPTYQRNGVTYVGTEPTPYIPRPQTVINESFALNAGELKWYQQILPRPGKLTGTFTSQNGVICAVVDAANLPKLRDGKQFLQYYYSGNLTSGQFETRLSAGTFYIVFDNRYSSGQPTGVGVKIDLTLD